MPDAPAKNQSFGKRALERFLEGVAIVTAQRRARSIICVHGESIRCPHTPGKPELRTAGSARSRSRH